MFQTKSYSLRQRQQRARILFFEKCEDRRMLSGTRADIVFLVDESISPTMDMGGGDYRVIRHVWLEDMITHLEDDLRAWGIGDESDGPDDINRYGLIGFGDDSAYAHSHVVGDASRYSSSKIRAWFNTVPWINASPCFSIATDRAQRFCQHDAK
ncbi:MAG: hypothetical protein JW829_04925 [Pirellulales bacterium]|nr:hypothetical protein [Pirellulales bacterium]